ncbi:GTPase IMAP family member 4-like isoform X1 [Gigantopelta aegis]|uniref:GTPase IMAP family member 4-like isoform X1 n=2 Tax=Gigantopelta aegis TaxID=1735272 RepID=UPI001B88CC17|nr:GTPase IMAP family member 4-like isoform X1 [Gigantopelta aegis]
MDRGHGFLNRELRMVLIGITGSGKSTTGNSILGRACFPTECSAQSVTTVCQKGSGSRFDCDLYVIDTPGLFDTGRSDADVTREILKCIAISAPGPHAFILVLKVGRFTAEENATVDYFKDVFGKEMLRYLFVLFTGMDDLENDGVTLDEYISKAPQNLVQLIQECNGKYAGINNRATEQVKESQVNYLINMIKSNVKINNGTYYTTEMLAAAEIEMQKREQQILSEKEEEIRREREEVERRCMMKREEMEKRLKEENDYLQIELQRKEKESQRELQEIVLRQNDEALEMQKRQQALIEMLMKQGEDMKAELEKRRLQDEEERMKRIMDEKKKKFEEESKLKLEEEIRRLSEKMARDEKERKIRDDELKACLQRMEEKHVQVARKQARDEAESGVPQIIGFMWDCVTQYVPFLKFLK